MTRRFSGGSQVWDTPAYTVGAPTSRPIARPASARGAKTISSARWPMASGRAGRWPQMPFAFYKILTARDLEAIVAYMRSVAPVRNQVPPPVYKAAMHVDPVPNAEKPISEDGAGRPVKRGFYLATIAHCMECHWPRPDGTQDYTTLGQGRLPVQGSVGLGGGAQYHLAPKVRHRRVDRREIKRSLTHGGRATVAPSSSQWPARIISGKMTDGDVDAIVAWIRTIPSIE